MRLEPLSACENERKRCDEVNNIRRKIDELRAKAGDVGASAALRSSQRYGAMLYRVCIPNWLSSSRRKQNRKPVVLGDLCEMDLPARIVGQA